MFFRGSVKNTEILQHARECFSLFTTPIGIKTAEKLRKELIEINKCKLKKGILVNLLVLNGIYFICFFTSNL